MLAFDPLNMRPEQYAAGAAWATFAVLFVTLIVVWRQLSEARRMRFEQSRPWIVVHFEFRQMLAMVVVTNVGRTVARNVRVRFEQDPEATLELDWVRDSALFNEGMPVLPPGHKVRADFDVFHTRVEAGLPMRYDVTVTYEDPFSRPLEPERFPLDLNAYTGTMPPDKGLPELVQEVERVRGEVKKWTDGTRGVLVHVVDRDRFTRRRARPRRIREVHRILREKGIRALFAHLVWRWRVRRGFYVR